MAAAHPLDRPAWSALVTRWAAFAQGSAQALQLAPQYGPFAAAADGSPESLAALAALAPSTDGLWIVEPEPFAAPPGLVARSSAVCNQGRQGGPGRSRAQQGDRQSRRCSHDASPTHHRRGP